MKKRLALLAAACLCMAVSMTSFAADKSDIVVAVDADVDTIHPTDFSTTVELGRTEPDLRHPALLQPRWNKRSGAAYRREL